MVEVTIRESHQKHLVTRVGAVLDSLALAAVDGHLRRNLADEVVLPNQFAFSDGGDCKHPEPIDRGISYFDFNHGLAREAWCLAAKLRPTLSLPSATHPREP